MTPQEQILAVEQYKAYLQDLGNIGGRLDATRNFYLSILSALFVLLSLTGKDGMFLSIAPQVTLIIFGVSILICYIWYVKLRTYNALLRSKFEVLQKMELDLPFKCFRDEWALFQEKKPIFLIKIDTWIPWVLMAAFALLLFVKLQS